MPGASWSAGDDVRPAPAYIRDMYQFDIAAGSKAELYRDLHAALDALTAGEADAVANMANASALIWQYLPDLNWAGFYRMVGGELVLGPFQGKAACIRIPVGKGVCGAAVATRETQRVDDVHAFPGHIACDAASRSELVVPVLHDGRVIGVLDLDSPEPSRFDAEDQAGCEALVTLLAPRLAAAAD
ncbi:L-methionine (R)-S-oxide reductase [Sphingomonas sp. SORGH_AS789]|nr:L-methionine (R)-S-oxide reductase [Sphingomonas sp. SORGH_AS_0789]MDR6151075.1 L-methionine (R)-S-oxide reductase [Sphingomonas sp. SORGH_AS_0742]